MLITHNICYCNAHTAIIIFDCALSCDNIVSWDIWWVLPIWNTPFLENKDEFNAPCYHENDFKYIYFICKLLLTHWCFDSKTVINPFFCQATVFYLLVLIFFLNWLFYHHCIAAFTHVKGAFENWLLSVGFYSKCCVNILYFGMSTFACWMVYVVFSTQNLKLFDPNFETSVTAAASRECK